MKLVPQLVLALTALAALAVTVAADAKEEVTAAAKKLAGETNYSWKAVTVLPESSPFKPGPTEGKTEKDGFTMVTLNFGDNITEFVKKGEKLAITDQGGKWKLAAEMEKEEGPGQFIVGMVRGMKVPAAEALALVEAVKELKKDGDAYTGELTPEGVKKQFVFGEPKNPKGAAKFWLKDGSLVKMEIKVEAKMEFGGNEFDAARTTTTEISKVGSTAVNVPTDAKKKLAGDEK